MIACVGGIDPDPETLGRDSPEGVVDCSSFDLADLEARACEQPMSTIDVVVHQIKRSFVLLAILGLSNDDMGSASQLHDGESFSDDNRSDPDGLKPLRGWFDALGLHLGVAERCERAGIGISHEWMITRPGRIGGSSGSGAKICEWTAFWAHVMQCPFELQPSLEAPPSGMAAYPS